MSTIVKLEQNSYDFSPEQMELLKNTVCKGATNDELQIFAHVCRKTGLDPFIKQIHAIKRPDYAANREVMTIQTGIDGYRLIAERTGRYAPGKEPTYQYDKDGRLVSSTAYVKKQTLDGTWHEVCATAFFVEYVQKKRNGDLNKFWLQMPHGQIAKCAEALALRRAFPQEMSGIYTHEEMAQASNPIDSLEEVGEDGVCSPVVPKKSVVELPKDKIEHVKVVGYEDFITRNGIIPGESLKYEYILHVSTENKMSEVQVVNAAVKNEEKFNEAFAIWLNKKQENIATAKMKHEELVSVKNQENF